MFGMFETAFFFVCPDYCTAGDTHNNAVVALPKKSIFSLFLSFSSNEMAVCCTSMCAVGWYTVQCRRIARQW